LFAWPQNPITSNLSVRTENTKNKDKLKINKNYSTNQKYIHNVIYNVYTVIYNVYKCHT